MRRNRGETREEIEEREGEVRKKRQWTEMQERKRGEERKGGICNGEVPGQDGRQGRTEGWSDGADHVLYNA